MRFILDKLRPIDLSYMCDENLLKGPILKSHLWRVIRIYIVAVPDIRHSLSIPSRRKTKQNISLRRLERSNNWVSKSVKTFSQVIATKQHWRSYHSYRLLNHCVIISLWYYVNSILSFSISGVKI